MKEGGERKREKCLRIEKEEIVKFEDKERGSRDRD